MTDLPANPSAARPVRRDGVLHADLCVIGAGAAGLSLAAGAVQMGASVVLVEKHLMGGECLNTGCVPSKALLAAAHAAAGVRRAARFGITAQPVVDFAAVMAHVRKAIATIAPHDGEERFRGLGCEVIRGAARFTAPDMVEAGGERIRSRRFAIATGSRPAVPPLPGLDSVPFLTNETIFGLSAPPRHLIVLGGGPVGVELAQAFRRLGADVSLVERARILPREEPEAVAVLRAALQADGVRLLEGAEPRAARADGQDILLDVPGHPPLRGSHLLVAAGREPDVSGLGLEAADIAATPRGIVVDARLRTTNRRVFALGDVTGGPAFTHVAGAHAAVALQNILFGIPARFDATALPRVTYTEPEIAQVGLTEAEAREAGHAASAILAPLSDNDRAVADGATEGFAKLVLGPRGRILGGTLVAPHAGEAIGLVGLAIGRRLGAAALARALLPYPTIAEAVKRAAGAHFAPALFGARTRLLVRLLQRLLP